MKYTFGILILGLIFLGSFGARVNHTSQYFAVETNTEPVEIRLQEDIEENTFNILIALNTRLKELELDMKSMKRTLNSMSSDNEFNAVEAKMENKDQDQYEKL